MIHSFLLIGQSNMAGRGFINEAMPLKSEKIKVLRNGRWQPIYRPVHCDRAFSGVCLAESFAQAYINEHDAEVGLIPCADGGTSLEQWKPGGLLFDNAVNNARLAMRTSEIVGVLWHQGEAECGGEKYKSYKKNFEFMLNKFREKLNLADVTVIIGGLGDFLKDCKLSETLKNYIYVNTELKKIADSDAMIEYVSVNGLTANPDNLHFNSKSLYEFGLRYYEAFKRIEVKDRVFKEKMSEDEIIRTAMESL